MTDTVASQIAMINALAAKRNLTINWDDGYVTLTMLRYLRDSYGNAFPQPFSVYSKSLTECLQDAMEFEAACVAREQERL